MAEIWAALILYRLYVGAAILAIALALLFYYRWEEISFWWFHKKMNLPGGWISSNYKHTNIANTEDGKNKWFESQINLCDQFRTKYDSFNVDGKMYEKATSYLEKVREKGRRPFPKPMWIIIFALVIAEALGFAYVLAGYTIPGASESLQQIGALGIAFVISIILVALTHATGGEIYRNKRADEVHTIYNKEINLSKYKDRQLNLTRSSTSSDKTVDLAHNENDDAEPECIKMLNRLNIDDDATRSWTMTIVTTIFIVLVAIGATYVRGQVLEKQLIQEVSTVSTNVYASAPAELAEAQSSADNKALEEQQDADRKGGWATFIVLAVLFVFIQILGIRFGFQWGFMGKESRKAFEYSDGFRSATEFVNFYNAKKAAVAKIADERLSDLQKKMSKYLRKNGAKKDENDLIKITRTFNDYLEYKSEVERQKNESDRRRRIEEARSAAQEELEMAKIEAFKARAAQSMSQTAQNIVPRPRVESEPAQTTAPQVEPINNFAKVIQEIKSKAQEAFDRDDDALSSALKQVRKSLEAASGAEEAAKILKEQASKAFDDDNEELAAILKHARKTLES